MRIWQILWVILTKLHTRKRFYQMCMWNWQSDQTASIIKSSSLSGQCFSLGDRSLFLSEWFCQLIRPGLSREEDSLCQDLERCQSTFAQDNQEWRWCLQGYIRSTDEESCCWQAATSTHLTLKAVIISHVVIESHLFISIFYFCLALRQNNSKKKLVFSYLD